MDAKAAFNPAQAGSKTGAAPEFSQPLSDHELGAVAGGTGPGQTGGNASDGYECSLCRRRFSSFDELEMHQQLFHSYSSTGGMFA